MADTAPKHQHTLSRQGLGMIFGLCVQYILGIIVLIYVSFPEEGNAKVMWEYARTQPIVMAHILFGTLLFIGSVAFCIRAFRAKDAIWIPGTLIGLVGIVGAWMSGEEFVASQNDVYSLLMAVFFIFSVLAYTVSIYRSKALAASR
jgi:hypothetical protein